MQYSSKFLVSKVYFALPEAASVCMLMFFYCSSCFLVSHEINVSDSV